MREDQRRKGQERDGFKYPLFVGLHSLIWAALVVASRDRGRYSMGGSNRHTPATASAIPPTLPCLPPSGAAGRGNVDRPARIADTADNDKMMDRTSVAALRIPLCSLQ